MIIGDFRDILKNCYGKYDTVFIDPPYNIGLKYDGYNDNNKDYEQLIEDSIRISRQILTIDGTLLIVQIPQNEYITLKYLNKYGFNYRNHIRLHYTFGQSQKTKFTPSHSTIFYYTIGSPYFNSDSIRIYSDRELKYNDKRQNKLGKVPNDIFVANSDVWKIARKVYNSDKHPTQLPAELIERLILATTHPKGKICDFFAGIGTIENVAKQLFYHCDSIDIYNYLGVNNGN